VVVKHLPRTACLWGMGAVAQSSRKLPPGEERLLVHSEGYSLVFFRELRGLKERITEKRVLCNLEQQGF
jgi:hypothetical protein